MFKITVPKIKTVAGAVAASSLALLAPTAFAETTGAKGPDLTSLTDSVDFGTTITALLAIAALLAGVYIAIKGAKTVLGMIRGR